MNDALYKVTGQVMHAAHMLYLSVAQFHKGVCENKGRRALKKLYGAVLPAEDALAVALAVWKTDVQASCGGALPLPKERPALAVVHNTARGLGLFVSDLLIAIEGDRCHDTELTLAITDRGLWDRTKLDAAAARINVSAEARQ